MTVAVNDTIERYTITGAGPYAYTWRIFSDTDLQVYALSTGSPPVPTLLTYLTHYTVSGANDAAGGSITLTAAAIAIFTGFKLDIRSNTPRSQPTSIRNQARFLPEIHEDAYDNLDRQIQDIGRLVDASVRAPDYELPLSLILPPVATRASKYLVFDLNGQMSVSSGTGNDSALRTDLANGTSGPGAALIAYKNSAAEFLAGVTPTDYTIPSHEYVGVFHAARYGFSSSASAATNTTALNNASKVANYAGGGIVQLPAGTFSINGTILFYTTPNLGQVIFRGLGKVATTLNYTGSAAAFGVSAASTRIYDCGIRDLTVVNSGGLGTIGLDLDSVSTSNFEHVTISGFPRAVKLRSTISGGALYTRFYDVTAQMGASPVVGFEVAATQSNATHFIACRYNGPNNTVGSAWKITDAIGVTVTDCDIDQALIGFELTSSGAGNCDYNIFKGNRIELLGTAYSIGTNVRFTKIFGNAYQTITTMISDSGTFTDFWDPPARCYENIAASGLSATVGARTFTNKADPGGAFPFILIDDNVSSTAGASGMRILKSASNGMALESFLSGTLKFQVSAPGGIGLFGATAPTSRPNVVGSKGANAALTSLMTALAACGIVTDSTT